VYHAGLNAVLLVNAGLGSSSSPPSSARTTLWRWTGSDWTVLNDQGPPVRNLGGVAYDALRNRLVMFGGTYSQDLNYGDTWEWDPAGGWQEKQVQGPGNRDHVKMVYDAALQRVVMYGGQVNVTTFPADTWTWDGTTWERIHTTGPTGRVHYGLAFDAASQRTYLFGGAVPGAGRSGDTWYLAASGWTSAALATTARSHAELAVSSRGLLLVGGFPAGQAATVQRLTSTGWTEDAQPGHPGSRYLTATAYDPVRQVTVLFGGGPHGANTLLNDTWEFHESTGWVRKQ
jgi:hypothetical protein